VSRGGLAYLALAVLGWGSWGVLTKVASVRLHWGTTQLLTVVGSTLVVLFLCIPAGAAIRLGRPYLVGVLAGVLVALGNVAYFKAVETVPVSVAYPVGALNLLLPVLAGLLFMGETLTWTKVLGVLFALAAVILLGL
jgi:transporter family protein